MAKITKTQFAQQLSDILGLTIAQSENTVNATLDLLEKILSKGDSVTFPGFGSFQVSERAERDGVNPKTGDKIRLKARKSVHFKSGKNLKEAVN